MTSLFERMDNLTASGTLTPEERETLEYALVEWALRGIRYPDAMCSNGEHSSRVARRVLQEAGADLPPSRD